MKIRLTEREMFNVWTSLKGFYNQIEGLSGYVEVEIAGELIDANKDNNAIFCQYFIDDKDREIFEERMSHVVDIFGIKIKEDYKENFNQHCEGKFVE